MVPLDRRRAVRSVAQYAAYDFSSTMSASRRSLITARLDTMFVAEDALRSVRVETNNSVVSLSGSVPSEASRLRAIALAKSTAGVSRVQNHINNLGLPRFRGQLVYAASAPTRKSASVSFGDL
jgi:osmotically-inducible protein OsmY